MNAVETISAPPSTVEKMNTMEKLNFSLPIEGMKTIVSEAQGLVG